MHWQSDHYFCFPSVSKGGLQGLVGVRSGLLVTRCYDLNFFRKNRKTPKILAAVDLGSNSFHMIVARLSHGQPKVIDRLREMVRLAGGLDDEGRLDPGRELVALECLARFGERLRDIKAESVRVVGTNTLRQVGQDSDFVVKAEEAIGHPVEVISGMEEARLIYQGVHFSSPSIDGTQIVVDIGGGSTEIIRGQGADTDAMESLDIGCVNLSERAFPNGEISLDSFRRARLMASLELEPVRENFRRIVPVRVSGASGTIRAAQSVINELAGSPTLLTIAGMQKMIEQMIAAGHIDAIDLPGLSEQRRPVFPGGAAILIEFMASLGIQQMHVSDGALREGLLYDLVGRLRNEDSRDRTVRSMEMRFSIDAGQADRVEKTAMMLLKQVARPWKIKSRLCRNLLRWAARLHEIGLHIAHSKYHHHGAYLLENADMPGFPEIEQRVLARIVGEQRGRLNRQFFADIPQAWEEPARSLTVLLRLAVLFNRGRADQKELVVNCSGTEREFTLTLAPGREDNPLTWADLEREQALLATAGINMQVLEQNSDQND